MGVFPFGGKSKGLEIRPVIRGFQPFGQPWGESETAVIMRLSQNQDEIEVLTR